MKFFVDIGHFFNRHLLRNFNLITKVWITAPHNSPSFKTIQCTRHKCFNSFAFRDWEPLIRIYEIAFIY